MTNDDPLWQYGDDTTMIVQEHTWFFAREAVCRKLNEKGLTFDRDEVGKLIKRTTIKVLPSPRGEDGPTMMLLGGEQSSPMPMLDQPPKRKRESLLPPVPPPTPVPARLKPKKAKK